MIAKWAYSWRYAHFVHHIFVYLTNRYFLRRKIIDLQNQYKTGVWLVTVDMCEMWHRIKNFTFSQDSGHHLCWFIITLKETRGMKTIYNSEIFLRIVGGIVNEVIVIIWTETAVWKYIQVHCNLQCHELTIATSVVPRLLFLNQCFPYSELKLQVFLCIKNSINYHNMHVRKYVK